MTKAIIIVDIQNDFVTGSLGTLEAKKILPQIVKKLSSSIDDNMIDLFFTQDTHEDNYLNTSEGRNLPIKHCIKNSEGWEIVPELQKFTSYAKAIIEKNTFGSTRLPSLLKDYGVVELIGVCTDICVVSNALLIKSFYPELDLRIDASCCAGSTPEAHKKALDVMRNCQCRIINEE